MSTIAVVTYAHRDFGQSFTRTEVEVGHVSVFREINRWL